jgi:hypothetical protein
MQRDGSEQSANGNLTFARPRISRNGNQYLNPETYLNSQHTMPNKRTPIKPDNFIGFKTLRPDNMQPNRQHTPTSLNPPVTIPILKTAPIPKIYN